MAIYRLTNRGRKGYSLAAKLDFNGVPIMTVAESFSDINDLPEIATRVATAVAEKRVSMRLAQVGLSEPEVT